MEGTPGTTAHVAVLKTPLKGTRWGLALNSQESTPLALSTHQPPLEEAQEASRGTKEGKVGWADCKTGASPPSTVSGLGLLSIQQSHTTRKDGHPIPFRGEALGCGCCLLFCFLP